MTASKKKSGNLSVQAGEHLVDMHDAAAIIASAQEPRIIKTEAGTPFLGIPPGWSTESLEDYLPAPIDIEAHREFYDVDSFAIYLKTHALADDSLQEHETVCCDPLIMYANESQKHICAILDSSLPDYPSHERHRATLSLQFSPEWETWKAFCGKYVSRKTFTRFVENHLENIVGDFSGGKILEMCSGLKLSVKSDTDINEIKSDGKRSLEFRSSAQAQGTLNGTRVSFPETIEVDLRIFKNLETYTFKPRLRWDIDQNEIVFCIDLIEAAVVEEKAFNKVLEQVKDQVGQKPLMGRP